MSPSTKEKTLIEETMEVEGDAAVGGASSSSGAGLAAVMDAAEQAPVPNTPVKSAALTASNDMQDVNRARPKAEPGNDTPEKLPTTKIRVEEVCASIKVQDLQNVDESLEVEAEETTEWKADGEDDEYVAEKDDELKRLVDHSTYEEIDRESAKEKDIKILKSGWVLTKTGEKKKARFVAKEIAYKRTQADSRFFAATPSVMGLRLLLLMAALWNWGAVVTDIASAFLNAHLP